jgi:two-component system response regulator PilR (NtrC family)
MSLPWKGNVRELDNVIAHSMILAGGDWIGLADLPPSVRGSREPLPPFTSNLKEALRQFERQHVRQVIDQVSRDRKEAARLLDVSLSTLYRKLEELELA